MESRRSDSYTEVAASTHLTRKQPPWHYLYFLLAILNTLTIAGIIHVQRDISAVYSDTVAFGQQWEQRSNRYVRLGLLANALNAPGNDVFTSRDPERESARARIALEEFTRELNLARNELKDDPALVQLVLRHQLNELQATAIAMSAETDQVFAHFASTQLDKASESMARMERQYGEITNRLATLNSDIHVIQQDYFDQKGIQTATLKRQQTLMIIIIALFMVVAPIYGYRLSGRAVAAMQERALDLAALQQSEARLRRIANNLPNGMIYQYRLRADGAVSFPYVSPQSYSVFGVEETEVLENPASLTDLVHPEDRAAFIQSLADSARLLLPWRWEGRIVTRSGVVKWVQGAAIPQRQSNGDILWDGFFADGSEHRKIEEALRKSEERFALAMEGTDDGLWDWDLLSNEMYFSPRLKSILRYSDTIVRTFNDFAMQVHPEDRPRVDQAIQDHQTQKLRFDIEYRLRMGDGSYLWVQSRGQAVWDEARTPIRMVGSTRDVSKRKQLDIALQASEERFRFLCAAAPIGIFENDAEGRCTYINPRLCEIAGLTSGQMREDALTSTIMAEDREAVLAAWYACLCDGQDFSREYRYQHANGEIRWVHRHAVAVYDGEGHLRGYVGTVEDITERKLAEAAQRGYLQDMEDARAQIEEQADSLQMQAEELSEAMWLAEQANQAKSEFLATMSHEIRTPMNGVIGMTGLLLDTELTPQQREFAGMIKSSGEALLTIINDILDFSKIEAGKLELEIVDLELRSAVEEALELLAPRAQEKGLELTHLLNADVPTAVRGDPGRLRQVLLNLTTNALKFTEEGEVTVRVTLDHDTPTHIMIRCTVSDTGIGIPPDRLERLFRSFSQVDASTTRKYGGTGLGLAISKQLVGLMGGEIGVESTPGHGSTFWFTARLEKQTALAQDTVLQPRADLRGLRVLVVDDNATNRTVLHHYLTNWGVIDESAADGVQALQRLRAALAQGRSYDVAILDYQMPNMDGLELAQCIKADPKLAGLKLVMLTSIVQRGTLEKAQHAGIDAYLAKPIRPMRLGECLTLVMRGETTYEEKEKSLLVNFTPLTQAKSSQRPLVLVAEDNTVNQKLAVLLLEKLGYRVDVVANGREAVEAVKRIDYAAVLMDCQMPEMDGFDATRIIRAHEAEDSDTGAATIRVPIIAMTANAMQGDRDRCLTAGMDDYLSKPITPEGLATSLARWVVEREGTEAAKPTAVSSPAPTSFSDYVQEVEELLRRVGGERGLLMQVSEVFEAEYPEMIAGVRSAIARQDVKGLQQAAHTLKGAIGNMAAQRAYEAASSLEQMKGHHLLIDGNKTLQLLEREVSGFRYALNTMLREAA